MNKQEWPRAKYGSRLHTKGDEMGILSNLERYLELEDFIDMKEDIDKDEDYKEEI